MHDWKKGLAGKLEHGHPIDNDFCNLTSAGAIAFGPERLGIWKLNLLQRSWLRRWLAP